MSRRRQSYRPWMQLVDLHEQEYGAPRRRRLRVDGPRSVQEPRTGAEGAWAAWWGAVSGIVALVLLLWFVVALSSLWMRSL